MTSHELAKRLLEGPDILILVEGYEGGYTDKIKIEEPKEFCLNVNTSWYYGEHEQNYEGYDLENKYKKSLAINLSRKLNYGI